MDEELFELLKELMPKDMEIEDQIEQLLVGTNLFGTIIIDTYTQSEVGSIYSALNVVCNKLDYFAFDNYGIYTFWDFYSKEILYIGLSNNIRNRFAQHNGLSGTSGIGNKNKFISEYFNIKNRLGYTILVQSPYEHNNEYFFSKEDEIRIIEGALIEDFRRNKGKLPKWNDIGGNVYGRSPYVVNRYGNIFDMIVGTRLGFLNAKSTLRELAKDTEKLAFENDLNVVRGRMYQFGESFNEAAEKLIRFNDFMHKRGSSEAGYSKYRLMRLCKSSYLKKELILPIE